MMQMLMATPAQTTWASPAASVPIASTTSVAVTAGPRIV